MFPLKIRRKFARISKKGLTANIVFNDLEFTAKINDVSASGCNIVFDDKNIDIKPNEIILVNFVFNNKKFSIEATKVRENGFNFKFENRAAQAELNNEILVEYFKDTPELIPIEKEFNKK